MGGLQISLFDYNQLDSETRIVVRQRTGEIKALMKRTAQDIIEIGEKLIEVKVMLPHGEFGGWLESEFGWNVRAAQRFMSVADSFKNDNLSHLDNFAPSALYLLASPSTPEEARTEAIARAKSGERITHKAAKKIVYERIFTDEHINEVMLEAERVVAEEHEKAQGKIVTEELIREAEAVSRKLGILGPNESSGLIPGLALRDQPEMGQAPPPPKPYVPQHTTAASFQQAAPAPALSISRPAPAPALPPDLALTPAEAAAALDELFQRIETATNLGALQKFFLTRRLDYLEAANLLRNP